MISCDLELDMLFYIPIDFIKAEIIGLKPKHFIENEKLGNPTSIFKGEQLMKTIYSYKNLRIRIFENNNRIEFTGSLHTFYNEGLHNHNDFNFNAFKESLNTLYNDLGIRPKNLRILHLEWGFNIKPPRVTNYILDSLLQHCSVNITTGIDCKIEGKYTQFKHANFILKIYNKGKQFKLEIELMRIEIKQTNWSKYRAKGISTLQDFIESDKTIFLNELLNQWGKVILCDIDNAKNHKFIKYQTSQYWNDLRKDFSGKTFKKHSDRLKTLNRTIGFNTQDIIMKTIKEKGNELQL